MNVITLATSRFGPPLSSAVCDSLTRRQTQQLTATIDLCLANQHCPMIAALCDNIEVVLDLAAYDP